MSRQLFPRQSASGSGGVATSSPGDGTVPGSVSSGVDTITSVVASATGVTSAPPTSASPSSSPSSSQSIDPTTTSTSPGTTSTPQSTPSSTSSIDSVPSTSSLASISPASPIPSSTTSSTALPSSSVSPSTTTQPSTPSSSQQGTPTTITSSYTTYVNGSAVVTQTSFPGSILPSPTSSTSNRAAIIGGSAAGGTALLIILLSVAFYARRKHFKKLNFLDAIRQRRRQIRSRATLLDDGDLNNIGLRRPPQGYTDYETPWDARDSRSGSDRALIGGSGTQNTPHTSTRPLHSETGLALREDVWHPPHEGTRLMDPLANTDDPDLDLTRIVDDVMGPSAAAVHFSDRSVSSMYRDSVAGLEGAHSRTVSNASHAALLEAAGLGGTSTATAPVRPSPLTQPETRDGNTS